VTVSSKFLSRVIYLINSAFTRPAALRLVASVPVLSPRAFRIVSIAALELIPRRAKLILQKASSRVCLYLLSLFLNHVYAFSFPAFEGLCSSDTSIPSLTMNSNAGTPQSTANTATLLSTTPVPTTSTHISQVVIGPSSTTSSPNTASSVGSTSTSTASTGGSPFSSSASTNKIVLHWTVALLGLAAGNLLVF
jgi:hypothetical protein